MAGVDDDIVRRCMAVPGFAGSADEHKVRRLAQLCHNTDLCVEVGVWAGRSLLAMALGQASLASPASMASPRTYGVDPWSADATMEGWHGPGNKISSRKHEIDEGQDEIDHEAAYNTCRALVSDMQHVILLRVSSAGAAPGFAPGIVDVVHIDGNNSADSVLADLGSWAPTVKAGGCLVLSSAGGRSRPAYNARQWLACNGWVATEDHVTWAVYRRV
jgi:hypothetical protein